MWVSFAHQIVEEQVQASRFSEEEMKGSLFLPLLLWDNTPTEATEGRKSSFSSQFKVPSVIAHMAYRDGTACPSVQS